MAGLLDIESWRRSWGPSLRVFGYISASFVLLFFLFVAIPFWLGFPNSITQVGGMLFALGFLFSIPLSFFKVLDEQQPGEIPLQMA